jgi:CRP-like cAMP-binding protein
VTLEQKKVLFEQGEVGTKVYFPTNAIVSLVVSLSSGEITETGMVGRDGIVGAAAAMDGKIAMNRAIVQLAGEALVCDASVFKSFVMQNLGVLSVLFHHEQTVCAQAQQSVACMASHQVEARLARWLLRSRDLTDSTTLLFTQEFISEMLGVRRSSVSTVAHTLQNAGMIECSRGKIKILNIEALQETACECYETVRSQYGSLTLENRNYSPDRRNHGQSKSSNVTPRP